MATYRILTGYFAVSDSDETPIYHYVQADSHEEAIEKWLKGGLFGGFFRRREQILRVTKVNRTHVIIFDEENE